MFGCPSKVCCDESVVVGHYDIAVGEGVMPSKRAKLHVCGNITLSWSCHPSSSSRAVIKIKQNLLLNMSFGIAEIMYYILGVWKLLVIFINLPFTYAVAVKPRHCLSWCLTINWSVNISLIEIILTWKTHMMSGIVFISWLGYLCDIFLIYTEGDECRD